MANLIKLSNTSWKQPFTDRKKELELWGIQSDVKLHCAIEDNSYRNLNIKFEDKFGISKTAKFTITSGKEIRFPRKFQDEIKTIVQEHPESFFIVTVLDTPHISFTPSDIIWIKNVTNKEGNHAYMDLTSDNFILHFPDNSGKTENLLNPKIDDIILLRQVIKGVPVFTHLVTPTDNERVDESSRADYRYGRRVRVIAKTDLTNLIPVSKTLWESVNFQGISQGNACKIETIKSVDDIDELRLDIWQAFNRHFVLQEQESANTTTAFLNQIEIDNPEISKTEAKLKLVSHLVKERNQEIVRI